MRERKGGRGGRGPDAKAKARAMTPEGGGGGGSPGPGRSLLERLAIVGLGLSFFYLHWSHVGQLFESDRHFSHLSNLEREMGFRTEMGLYYSYFKVVTEAPTFLTGVRGLYANNRTEFPQTINTLKRFNLYPEVILGFFYRHYVAWADRYQWQIQQCWQINRGQDLSPVLSCEGSGDPAVFYVNAVWFLSGFTTLFLFLIGLQLSDSILGGVLAVAAYFYNHGECTRVQWTPPLRESFAFPVCLAQLLVVTLLLQKKAGNKIYCCLLSASTCLFILVWQFAQFALFTQLCSLYAVYVLGLVCKDTFKAILHGLMLGLLAAIVLMFGNEMLFTSWFFSGAVCVLFIVYLPEPTGLTERVPRLIRIVFMVAAMLAATAAIKIGLSKAMGMTDDAHVSNILRSKFTDYRDFHTLLYTCAREFDFLGWEMPWKTTQTLLLPAAVLPTCLIVWQVARSVLFGGGGGGGGGSSEGNRKAPQADDSPDPCTVYHVLQLLCYALMALIIMRLKLFLSPQLCIVAGLVASKKLFSPIFKSREIHVAVVVALLAGMSVQGIRNINDERNIMGEYSNVPLEELIEWVNKTIPVDESLAGPMPLMANLLLSTRRPVINHPHYEDASLRERTRKVYQMFSRRSIKQVHETFKQLQANYLVISRDYCLSGRAGGCGMLDIWDAEEPERMDRQPACPLLWNSKDSKPFERVYASHDYVVLKI